MECPVGVDIPRSFAIYNEYCTTKVDNTFLLHMGVLGEEKQPKNCIQCGECLPKCPQQLVIPELMAKIGETVQGLRTGELPAWLNV